MRLGGRESVLETHDGLFRQHRIGHGEFGLIRCQMLQRDVAAAGDLVMQHGVTVEKSAAAAVLSGETDRIAFLHQAGIGKVLGAAPIQRQIAVHHFLARLHDGEHSRMQVPVGGIGRDGLAQGAQAS
jgi:hypothetical protein